MMCCAGLWRAAPRPSALIRHDLDALLDGDYLASFELDRCCEELTSVTGLALAYETPP